MTASAYRPETLALHAGWPLAVFIVLAAASTAMNVYIPLSVLAIARRYRAALRPEAAPIPSLAAQTS